MLEADSWQKIGDRRSENVYGYISSAGRELMKHMDYHPVNPSDMDEDCLFLNIWAADCGRSCER